MKPSFVPLTLVLVSVLLPLASLVLAHQKTVNFTQLEKVALEELKETNTPGAAVVVVSGDRLVFAKGFGVANIETGAPGPVEPRVGTTLQATTPQRRRHDSREI